MVIVDHQPARAVTLLLLVLAGGGCGREVDPDAGLHPDAGRADASALDGGEADAGAPNADAADPGRIDSGSSDGGATDATIADAAVLDADAGISDGGVAPCAVPLRIALGGEIYAGAPTIRFDTAWTGDGWLHVQAESGTDEDRVTAARISRDGVREGAIEIHAVPSSTLAGWFGTSVVWTGTRALAAWVRFRTSGSNEVWLAPLAPDGTPEEAPRRVITTSRGYWIDAAWTGSELGLVHGGSGGIRFQRVGPDGAPIGDLSTLLASGSTSPLSAAFNGSQHGVAWTDSDGAHLARVATDGVADAPQLVVPRAEFEAVDPPMLFADGSDWLLALRSEELIRVHRLSPLGVIRDFVDVALTDPFVGTEQGHRDYAFVPEPDGFAFAYVQHRETREVVFFRTDRAGLLRGGELQLSSHPSGALFGAHGPDLLPTDGAPAVTWSDRLTSSDGMRRYLRSACD